MTHQQTITAALKIMYELSRETFSKHEPELKQRFQSKGYIHGHVIVRILREMEDNGVPDIFANHFIQERLHEMRLSADA